MTSRTHVVLVPGFVGFDALGQLEYYAGVTEVFDEWRNTERARDRNPTLHYFPNFPTASVALRAKRLREYLLKRVARGEFSGDDRVTLIGHSTGGLDIRKAVYELANNRQQVVTVDATRDVRHDELLGYLKHLVFLSVPHYGTNLGDFGCMLADTAQGLLRDAGLALQLNREPIAALRRRIEQCVHLGSSDLLLAIADALNESDEDRGGDEQQRADEREARSELALWLEHMGKDFSVVNDLCSASGNHNGSESPAHFSHDKRRMEMAAWLENGISTRSYATIVRKRPENTTAFSWLLPALKAGAPLLNAGAKLLNGAAELWWLPPASLSAVLTRAMLPALAVPPATELLRRHPDAVFKTFYALCADPSGPFRIDAANIAPEIQDFTQRQPLRADTLVDSDSDGVVNTLSMLWPYEPAVPERHPHFLVEGDHADVIGHFARRPRAEPVRNGRNYDAYDIFPSGSGFDRARFEAVWTDVFESCP